jgi:peptidoglycan/LPS O-acetylase OafA/YrhL
MPSSSTTGRSPSTLRSIWAVVAGFLIVFVLSSLGDVVSKMAGLIPTDGSNPTFKAFYIFTAYRLVFTVLGGYVTARLAPRNPMKHAVILGVIGTAAALVGVFALASKHYGPTWYAWALVVTAIPCTWLGAKIHND